jgi:hypothetical protein
MLGREEAVVMGGTGTNEGGTSGTSLMKTLVEPMRGDKYTKGSDYTRA